jgi:hypothetical protein
VSWHPKAVLPLQVLRLFISVFVVVLGFSSPWIASALASGGSLDVSPGNLDFQTVIVGHTTTLKFQIKNTGSRNLHLYQVRSSKNQFTLSGPSVPFSLAPSRSAEFQVTFRPSDTKKTSALLEIISSAQARVFYTLSGKGAVPFAALQLSPTSISFGSVNLNSGSTRSVTVKNIGDISLNISGVTVLGGGFGFSHISPGVSLAPNEHRTFQVSFRPHYSGTASGKISIMSGRLPSPTTLPLAGSGVSPPPPPNPSGFLPPPSSTPPPGHLAIHLDWAPSSSVVVGYRVHRGVTKGGPYPNYTQDPLPTLHYNDTSAATGTAYFYVVTSIDRTGVESVYSNEVSISVTSSSASSSAPGSTTSTPPPRHTPPPVPPSAVHLSWAPSASAVVGYRVYRSLAQGGPYVDYNAGPLDSLSFDDSAVVAGLTYFYVVTSLDAEGTESVYSNPAVIAVPAR